MKYYLRLYLDESGGPSEEYFVVGGFYTFNTSNDDNENVRRKVEANVRRTEELIRKDYKINQRWSGSKGFRKKEIKWTKLSASGRKLLSTKFKNNGQINIAMISDMNNWSHKNSKGKINTDYVYNYMVRILIERICKLHSVQRVDTVRVSLNIDQRSDVPKSSEDEPLSWKALGLQNYLNTVFFMDKSFPDIVVTSKQYNSKYSEAIRYADYYAGMIFCMLRRMSYGKKYDVDKTIGEMYKTMTTNFDYQHWETIKTENKAIEIVCRQNKKES